MKIRFEKISDHNKIEALTYQAFENHPHHEPEANPTEHMIINKLRNNGTLSLSLVAEVETGIVGHIAFSPVTIGAVLANWYGLGPVSVSPSRQGEGIGSQLIEAGIAELKKQGAGGIVLLGEPGYYGRFGFKANKNLTLPGVPSEYFLIRSLANKENILSAGEVAYDTAFDG
ncbi:MAG: putative acetyltransferase [Desulforhopalus sp.]|jgi:putative acetyltransferase